MEPRSIERGEMRRDAQFSPELAKASMEPRSIERGERWSEAIISG